MIIGISTTDPLDAGPVNLNNIWNMMDWGRLTQRVFVNTAISGYWKVDEFGMMKKVLLLGDETPDVTFVLDMRKMDAGALHNIYQKLKRGCPKQKIDYNTSNKEASITIITDKANIVKQKTLLALHRLG